MTINDNDTILANAHAPLHPATMIAAAARVERKAVDCLAALGLTDRDRAENAAKWAALIGGAA